MLTAKKALAASRVYTEETVIGMGAIKGANCTIKSITKVGDLNTVIFSWTDTEGTEHEGTMLVYDGANGTDGQDGAPGADGFSPTITVKTATSSEYVLTITDKNGSYDTPNLKGGGGGGGGASSLSDLDDIALSALANGDALIYDSTSGKWKNVQLDIPSELSDLSDIDLASLADADILKYDFDNQKWVNGKLDYSELTGTPTLGTAAEKDSTNAITENSTDLIESGAVYTGLAAKADTADLGTAAAKDSTNAVTQSSTDLVESGAVYTALADKVDKEAGKGLSTNDFTDAEKSKLDNLDLDDLSDVDMTGITDGQVLAWDDANSKMVPADQTGTTYTAGAGIDISQQNEISSEVVQFSGTLAEWNALSTAEKIQHTDAVITDDTESGIVDNAPTQNSDHLVTSGGVYTALSAKADAANLGTAAAKDATNAVTQSSTDLVESGAVYTALGDKADKVESATNGDFAGLDASGNLTDSGKKASDFATAQGLADEAATRSIMGAKNMLPLDLANIKAINTTGTWSGNAYTSSGITYTVQTDADGSVSGINVNGTNGSVNNDLILCMGDLSSFAGKAMTGRPADATGTSIRAELIGSPYTNYGSDTGNGTVISSGIGANCKVFIRVDPNRSVSDNFYPMIRLATDADSTYQPYAKTNRELTVDKAELTQLTNPNLLDNPWFTVNQRGTTSATANSTFIADRWTTYSGNASYQVDNTSNGLSIDNTSGTAGIYVYQKAEASVFSNLNGRTVTASVLLSDGTIKSGTHVYSGSSNVMFLNDEDIEIATVPSSAQVLTVGVKVGKNLTIKAVKLEIGSVSTLAMDVAPNYQQELAKCQRYFVRVSGSVGGLGFAGWIFSTNARGTIPLPVPMRAKPTIKKSGAGSIVWMENSSSYVVATEANLAVYNQYNNLVTIKEDGVFPSITTSEPIIMRFDINAILDFSAEL